MFWRDNDNIHNPLYIYELHLIILEEALQELARVLQQTLPRFPVVVHLRARLLSGYPFGFDALHNAHSLNNQLHPLGRSLHGSHLWEKNITEVLFCI